MTPKFNMKNLRRDKKSRTYNWSKMFTMKNKKWMQGFTYLKPTNPSRITWLAHFHFQFHTFFLWSTLGIFTKFDLDIFFNPHKKKMGFHPSPNRLKIERWMNKRINSFFLKKICWKQFENQVENEIFLTTKYPKFL